MEEVTILLRRNGDANHFSGHLLMTTHPFAKPVIESGDICSGKPTAALNVICHSGKAFRAMNRYSEMRYGCDEAH